MANQERSWMRTPYHYCQKCWRRIHLDDMVWILGQLVCPWDQDTMLVGERETYMMRVLQGPQTELTPDRKLTQPNVGGVIDEVIL
jgi:hypothetical protein